MVSLRERFIAALEITDEQYEVMKKRLRHISDQHLDDRISVTKQDAAQWDAFTRVVFAEWPIFQRQNCKRLLYAYMSKFLGGRVYAHRARASEHLKQRHHQKRLGEVAHDSRAKKNPRHVNRTTKSPPPLSSPPAYQAVGPMMPNGIAAVEEFLQRAQLPNLLRAFCKAGIDSRAKLEMMASWQSSDLIDFLFEMRREGWITRFEGKVLELEFRK
ncbi:hypothetical protein F5I97DRAFT_1017272 [Phlebopus sp. FC_14]|nr:hypothetical protein F5I97DRAFT_1017272 [Phlebopus sp. FC_14]